MSFVAITKLLLGLLAPEISTTGCDLHDEAAFAALVEEEVCSTHDCRRIGVRAHVQCTPLHYDIFLSSPHGAVSRRLPRWTTPASGEDVSLALALATTIEAAWVPLSPAETTLPAPPVEAASAVVSPAVEAPADVPNDAPVAAAQTEPRPAALVPPSRGGVLAIEVGAESGHPQQDERKGPRFAILGGWRWGPVALLGRSSLFLASTQLEAGRAVLRMATAGVRLRIRPATRSTVRLSTALDASAAYTWLRGIPGAPEFLGARHRGVGAEFGAAAGQSFRAGKVDLTLHLTGGITAWTPGGNVPLADTVSANGPWFGLSFAVEAPEPGLRRHRGSTRARDDS